MNKFENEKLVLENYENEFSYKKDKSKLNITFNRIAFIFFVFLIISIIYSIKVIYLGSLNPEKKLTSSKVLKTNYRADILDRNGNFIVKTINTVDIGINPKLVIDKKNY